MEQPVLAEYVDYRKYLADFYQYQVQQTQGRLRPYSYSDFSAAANIKSPNYLRLIIEGKRNLSADMCGQFSRALRHNRAQTAEFLLLVTYCQEKDPMQRNRHLKVLSEWRAKKSMEAGKINTETWEQVSSWLVWVIYAMVDQEGVSFTPEKIRKVLRGQVNEAQVSQALQKLIDAGDIEIDPITNKARKTSLTMSGLDDIPTELIRKIQSELIYLGLESLHQFNPQEREVSGFTLAMTEKEFEWVRFELRKLRKHIQKEISMKRETTSGERVYQMNIQFFPLSDPSAEKIDKERPEEQAELV